MNENKKGIKKEGKDKLKDGKIYAKRHEVIE